MSEKEYKEKCNNMFAKNSILLHRIEELEAQIEKMKCCENCKNHYWKYEELDCRLNYSCYNSNYDKWEGSF